MTTGFALGRDINGYNAFGRQPSDDIWQILLSANTAASVTVPKRARVYECIFGVDPGLRLWVSTKGTAAIPTGGGAFGISELNPVSYYLNGGTVISVITPDSTLQLSIAFYAVQNT